MSPGLGPKISPARKPTVKPIKVVIEYRCFPKREGKIEIAAGVTQQVLLLKANGMPRPNGRYTAASHPDLVAGGGTLRVDDGNGFAIVIK